MKVLGSHGIHFKNTGKCKLCVSQFPFICTVVYAEHVYESIHVVKGINKFIINQILHTRKRWMDFIISLDPGDIFWDLLGS